VLQIRVYGVLDTSVIPVEMEELIANLVEPFHVEWRLLSLGRQVLFVAVNHCAQSICRRPIAGKLLVVRDRRLCGLHEHSLPRKDDSTFSCPSTGHGEETEPALEVDSIVGELDIQELHVNALRREPSLTSELVHSWR
jgi:hypothetical protein